jgi:hypothetical protein
MPRKIYAGPEWVTEDELLKVIHITPRRLQDLRYANAIPFKQVSQKVRLYVVEDVLDAIPEFKPKSFEKPVRRKVAPVLEVTE